MKKWMNIGIFILLALIAFMLSYSKCHDGSGGPYPNKQMSVNISANHTHQSCGSSG
jgi:hypothetical protein